MYDQTAQYYDLVYSAWKDFAGEVEKIKSLLAGEHASAATVLDVACGTGEHAKFLARDYKVDGIDLDPRMVEIARGKVPSGIFRVADMSDFNLKKRYDVILCLFSSIGYTRSKARLIAALTCFRRHLDDGGIIVVEPWFTPDNWYVGTMNSKTAEKGDLKICRMGFSEREGNIAVAQMHYLIGSSKGVEYKKEIHKLGLFTVEEMLSAFESAGLSAVFDPEGLIGRGLYVARKMLKR